MIAINSLNKERTKEMLSVIKEWCENEESELYYDGHKATWLSFDYPSELWEIRYPKKTIIVNGIEVPSPEKSKLKNRQSYFVSATDDDNFYIESCWCNDDRDNHRLNNGLIYLKEEDAISRAKAMLIFKEK